MIEITRRKYVKPHMEVYDLKNRAQLLVGSGERNPYDPTQWP